MPHKPIDEMIEDWDPNRKIEDSRTPPYTWYTDPQFFEREVQMIFQKNWMVVGRSELVSAKGGYFVSQIAGNPVVVVRSVEDGKLYAHHNVCRHKGAIVAQEHGQCQFFECGYHGWRYGHDGALLSAPKLGKQECFIAEKHRLQGISVDTWGPYVFLDLDGHKGGVNNPRGLGNDVKPLDEYLSAPFGTMKCEPGFSETFELQCNWKIFVDNSLDGGLHVSYIHGDTLAGGLQSPALETIIHRRTSVQIGKTNGQDKRLGDRVIYAFVFPNMFINFYGDMMDVNIVEPIGVDRCRVHFDFFFAFENHEMWDAKKKMRQGVATSRKIQDQDIKICNDTQIGMNSMSFKHGRYCSGYEQAVYEFHRLLWYELQGHVMP